jgi:polysaccharide pyruvyl transferase WcaK-like protein
MNKPVAILFSNLKGNIGDFAILHAMLLDLQARFPAHPVHVFPHSFLKTDESRLAAFKAAGAPPFELAGTTYFRKVSPKLKWLFRLRLWPHIQVRLVRVLAASAASDASQFARYEAIFLAGGDQWNEMDLGVSMFATLSAVANHNDNIYTFPFSVDPRIRLFNTDQALRGYFAKIREPLVVRDGISKAVIDELDLRSVLGADCVFSLQHLASGIVPTPGRDPSRVLFVVTGNPRTLEPNLRAALRNVTASTKGISLLTTCEPEDGQIYERLSREFDIPWHAPTTWQDAVAELKASSLIVTNRLHCLILGSFAGTPVLPVADRTKSAAFVRDAEMRRYVHRVDALTSGILVSRLADPGAAEERVSNYRDCARDRI